MTENRLKLKVNHKPDGELKFCTINISVTTNMPAIIRAYGVLSPV